MEEADDWGIFKAESSGFGYCTRKLKTQSF